MKQKFFYLFAMLCLAQNTMAQLTASDTIQEKSRFFPANSIRCTNAIIAKYYNDTVYYSLHTGNDTIIDGKNCVLLWCSLTPDEPSLIHEDGGKVYINYPWSEDEWMLLYDFSLPEWHVGDRIYDILTLNGNRSLPIDSVSTITLKNGEQRQVAHYDNNATLIYGLGFIDEPFFEIYNRLYPEDGSYAYPVDFYYNDELLWGNNKNEDIPTTSKTYLVTEGKQWAVYHNNPLCSKHRSGTTTYRLQGDTILYGKTYKKKWRSYKEDLSDMRPYNSFMREENGKVYFANSYEEKLWFDYTAQIGDTLCFKEGSEYGRINNIYEALLSETDSTRSYLCYEMQVGRYNSSKKEVEFVNQYINVYEGLGVIGRDMSYGLCEHYYQSSYDRQCSFTLLCVHNGENILYQTHEGCYRPYGEKPRPTTKRGYGIYYGDTYLYRYIINEGEAVTDSTDFARWNDKTVIYFDVDTIGPNAFSGATFRQGQMLYFTERLNCILPNAFSNIMMLDDKQAEEKAFGDLCIVFNGNAPSIDKSSISNYADTTYHITYVVPDLAAYIENDIQWTYSQLVTIDDFVRGYVSPENEITVNDSTDTDVNLQPGTNQDGNIDLVVHARPRKDIPVRIGEGENKDIYSRAPAWMRYTIELRITDTEGTELYAGEMQCSAYGECQFNISFACPANNIIHIYSRSIDMFGRATEWAVTTINLDMSVDPIVVPDTDAPYYDMQGRPVANPTRGIYIRNGRKVVL